MLHREICNSCITGNEEERRMAYDRIIKSAKSKQHNLELQAFITEGVCPAFLYFYLTLHFVTGAPEYSPGSNVQPVEYNADCQNNC